MARNNAKRTRVDLGLSPVIERPSAAPTDTFVRPAQETEASQLARALSEISPSIGKYSETLAADYVDKQRARGEQAARKASEEAIKAGDLTRMGKLPMQENPYFMSAYEEEWGRVAASMWHSDFVAAEGKNEALQKSTDMKDFDTAVGSHLDNWLKDKGVSRSGDFERGFGTMKDQYLAHQRLEFAKGIEKNLAASSDEALFQMVKKAVVDNWGQPNVSLEAISNDIDQIARAQFLRGRPLEKVQRATAAAIKAAALEQEDPAQGQRVLQLLGETSGGSANRAEAFLDALDAAAKGKPEVKPWVALKDTSFGSQVLDETMDQLTQEAHQRLIRKRQEEEFQKKEAREGVLTEAFKVLEQNPDTNMALWVKKKQQANPEAAKYLDPEIVGNLMSLQNQYKNIYFETNTAVYNSLFSRIWAPPKGESMTTVEEIVRKQSQKLITPQDASFLINQIENWKAQGSKKDPLDARAKPFSDIAEALFDSYYRNPTTGIAAGDMAERIRNSKAELLSKWANLKATGTVDKLSDNDLNKWFVDEANRILATQKSNMNISIAPAPQPTIGPLGQGRQQVTGKEPKVEDPLTKPLPESPVITQDDVIQFQRGNISPVAEAMRGLGLDPSRMREFLMQQRALLEKAQETKE